MSIGSVQLIAVAFPASDGREREVLALLRTLDELSSVRILDLLLVHKEVASGDLVALDVPGADHGAVIGALLGFEFVGAAAQTAPPPAVASTYGLGREDVEALGEAMRPGTSAGLVLLEHRWAAELERALQALGAEPLGNGLLTLATIADVAPELDAARTARDRRPAAT